MADEVFSGGVSVTGVEPGTTTIAIKSTTNPNISKKVPVTVKSRNLLSYGPASGNGLTATVNTDGSLHVTGTVTSRHKGLAWRCPTPSDALGKTVTYKAKSPSDTYSYVAFFNKAGNQVGDIALNKSVTVPADAASCELRLLAGDTYTVGTRIDDTFKPMLNLGDRALDWMKPDVTSLEGGGYELANLVPSFASLLPYTMNGVTFTSRDGHTVHVKGTTTAWAQINVSVRLDAGTYMLTCDNSNGWNYGTQFGGSISGHDSLGNPSAKLETGTYTVSVFVAEGKTVDIDLTPRIHRLD